MLIKYYSFFLKLFLLIFIIEIDFFFLDCKNFIFLNKVDMKNIIIVITMINILIMLRETESTLYM